MAVPLAVFGVLAIFLVSDRPDRPMPTRPLLERLTEAARLRVTWELSALYTIGFGGIVAFGVYLPTHLKNLYHLSQTDPGTKAAGFAVLAVVFRPLGGRLSAHPAHSRGLGQLRRRGPFRRGAGLRPGPVPQRHHRTPRHGRRPRRLLRRRLRPGRLGDAQPQGGSVTGIVGALGGLGGVLPPLVMSAVYGAKNSYSVGLVLLSDLARLAAMVYAAVRMRHI